MHKQETERGAVMHLYLLSDSGLSVRMQMYRHVIIKFCQAQTHSQVLPVIPVCTSHLNTPSLRLHTPGTTISVDGCDLVIRCNSESIRALQVRDCL